jgi:histone H3/H4
MQVQVKHARRKAVTAMDVVDAPRRQDPTLRSLEAYGQAKRQLC